MNQDKLKTTCQYYEVQINEYWHNVYNAFKIFFVLHEGLGPLIPRRSIGGFREP